ncbi:MAG: hypothetical protein AB8B63_25355 [Granulosicoccus sp.]
MTGSRDVPHKVSGNIATMALRLVMQRVAMSRVAMSRVNAA